MTKTTHTFNTDLHVKELNDRFKHLIKNNFGMANNKGTARYELEVSFAYALNEVKNSPSYMQGKAFEKASSIVGRLIAQVNKTEAV